MADKARQLSFDLPVEPRFGREDFLVSPSNQSAWSTFEGWPDWPDQMQLLIGPGGAGKSHLATIWAARADARVVAAGGLLSCNLPALATSSTILVEDADQAVGLDPGIETQLFHLINLVRASKAFLVLTARAFPDQWGLKTADLLSRLRRAPSVEIGAPDDALVRAVLVKLFVDRQLVVDTSLIEYLAVRIERSLGAARAIVEALDREALALGRPITRNLAGEVIRRLEGVV